MILAKRTAQRTGQAPTSKASPAVGRRALRVVAKTSSQKSATKGKVGFRWDGSMMRWIRDDRMADKEVDTTVKPVSGSEYVIWPVVHTELYDAGINGVTPEEAFKMQQQGWTIVDVRIEGDYKYSHAEGSINLPLFRLVQGNELWDNIKKIAMAGFAMKATERDPDYLGTVLSKIKKGQKIIVTCAIGGTLDTKLRLRPDKYKDGIVDADRSFGRESRSLKACYEFLQGGWNKSNMVFMKGGFQEWRHQGYPVTSD